MVRKIRIDIISWYASRGGSLAGCKAILRSPKIRVLPNQLPVTIHVIRSHVVDGSWSLCRHLKPASWAKKPHIWAVEITRKNSQHVEISHPSRVTMVVTQEQGEIIWSPLLPFRRKLSTSEAITYLFINTRETRLFGDFIATTTTTEETKQIHVIPRLYEIIAHFQLNFPASLGGTKPRLDDLHRSEAFPLGDWVENNPPEILGNFEEDREDAAGCMFVRTVLKRAKTHFVLHIFAVGELWSALVLLFICCCFANILSYLTAFCKGYVVDAMILEHGT